MKKRGLFPKDFLFWEGSGFHWLYIYEDGMEVPREFDIIGFHGGLYAVTTDIDQKIMKAVLSVKWQNGSMK